MGYRGDDLDLRTPERWGGKDVTRDLVRVAGEPYYVDDTVLACCNQASFRRLPTESVPKEVMLYV